MNTKKLTKYPRYINYLEAEECAARLNTKCFEGMAYEYDESDPVLYLTTKSSNTIYHDDAAKLMRSKAVFNGFKLREVKGLAVGTKVPIAWDEDLRIAEVKQFIGKRHLVVDGQIVDTFLKGGFVWMKQNK